MTRSDDIWRRRRHQFLRRAAAAELAALNTGVPQLKRAWSEIAAAWIEVAQATRAHEHEE